MSTDRESLDVDVLIVGAGPAGLAAAYRLASRLEVHREKLGELTVAVVEKGSQVGAHQLSGAVMDPCALQELIPDFLARGCPVESEVKSDEVLYLTAGAALRLPYVPPPLRQHGNYLVSLSNLVKWMAPLVEEKGVMILPGYAGDEVLYADAAGGLTTRGEPGRHRVAGVRMVDRGVNKKGEPKASYAPGEDVKAKVTLFCDGTYGNLTLKLVEHMQLGQGKNPQSFATGVKEVWELAPGRCRTGHVSHTMGWPLQSDAFGGGFIYHMASDTLAIGLVVGLDYADPFLDIHAEFQRFKTHPTVTALLAGGKLASYGAKTIPEGGWFAMPKLTCDGALILGDAAGMVNVPRLKGIHYAMQAGLLAADAVLEALLQDDFTDAVLGRYQTAIEASIVGRDLYAHRYFKEYFHGGFLPGLIQSGISFFTGGGFPPGSGHQDPDYRGMRTIADYHGRDAPPEKPVYDHALTFSKLDDIYVSGTHHEEDQPCHLVVKDLDLCATRCAEEYGNPCQRFCPASVYNMIVDDVTGTRKLLVNAPNCVHCKTCDIKDPYRNILWKVPEGSGGPNYVNL